jgi:hypothetical protein
MTKERVVLFVFLLVFAAVTNVSAYAGSESGYHITLVTPQEFADTMSEDAYKMAFIVNPATAGFLRTEGNYKLGLNLYTRGVSGAYREDGFELYLVPEQAFISYAYDITANDPTQPFTAPDLVITGEEVCWQENCTICYNVTNIGKKRALKGHNTTLIVDGVDVAYDLVPVVLGPGDRYSGCFYGYNWTYTPPGDNITVCADSNDTEKESSETNNCLTTIWMCGDVNSNDVVDMSDVIDLLYYAGYPSHYTVCSEWAADVNRDGLIDMSDARDLLYYVGYPGQYDLHCFCT